MRGKSWEGQTQYGMCYEGMEAFVRRACTNYYEVRRWGQQWGSIIIISFLEVDSDNICQEIYMRTLWFHLSNPQKKCSRSTAAAANTVYYEYPRNCNCYLSGRFEKGLVKKDNESTVFILAIENGETLFDEDFPSSKVHCCPPLTLFQSPNWLLGLGRLSIILSVPWMMYLAECWLRKQIRNCLHRQ